MSDDKERNRNYNANVCCVKASLGGDGNFEIFIHKSIFKTDIFLIELRKRLLSYQLEHAPPKLYTHKGLPVVCLTVFIDSVIFTLARSGSTCIKYYA